MNTYRIHVNPDGSLEVFVDNGTFESAAPAIQNLLKILADNGIEFSEINPPEQHRHDDLPGAHVHADGVVHHH